MTYEKIVERLREVGGFLDEDPHICREAANAIEELALKTKDPMTIAKTKLGTLIARDSGFGDEYPGILVYLQRESKGDLPLCLIEYTEDEEDLNDGDGHIITRVYGDALGDEVTDRVVHSNIEGWFNQEGEEK